MKTAAHPDERVYHARTAVHRPARPEAVGDDRRRLGVGEKRHEGIEMVARHFVERRLVHVRQIERLMARLAVEEMDVFDLTDFSRMDEPCHGAVMPIEAD